VEYRRYIFVLHRGDTLDDLRFRRSWLRMIGSRHGLHVDIDERGAIQGIEEVETQGDNAASHLAGRFNVRDIIPSVKIRDRKGKTIVASPSSIA
jgi:hypothetical protein